jgi:hypothetical protein
MTVILVMPCICLLAYMTRKKQVSKGQPEAYTSRLAEQPFSELGAGQNVGPVSHIVLHCDMLRVIAVIFVKL